MNPTNLTVPVEGVCEECREAIPANTDALYVPGKGVIHTGCHEDTETDQARLRDLAERLRSIPVMYGVDGGDIDFLRDLASRIG